MKNKLITFVYANLTFNGVFINFSSLYPKEANLFFLYFEVLLFSSLLKTFVQKILLNVIVMQPFITIRVLGALGRNARLLEKYFILQRASNFL